MKENLITARCDDSLELLKRKSWNRINNLKIYRARNCCEVCGNYYKSENLRGHHLISLRNGGKDEDDNIIILCFECNDAVHAFSALEQAGRIFDLSASYLDMEDKKDGVKKKWWQKLTAIFKNKEGYT